MFASRQQTLMQLLGMILNVNRRSEGRNTRRSRGPLGSRRLSATSGGATASGTRQPHTERVSEQR